PIHQAFGRVARRAEALLDDDFARHLVEKDEIGKGPANVATYPIGRPCPVFHSSIPFGICANNSAGDGPYPGAKPANLPEARAAWVRPIMADASPWSSWKWKHTSTPKCSMSLVMLSEGGGRNDVAAGES